MNSITALAPTKAFNLAGIQTSAVVIPNPEIRKAFLRQLNTDECAEPNVFSLPAAMAAFEESEDWLEELNEVIARNRKITEDFVKDNIPEIKVIHGQATYLLWLDVSKLGEGEAFASFLKEETGLIVNPGPEYGKGGEHFIRLNVACPLSRLQDGLNRLKNGAIAYKKKQNA
jgi:cystathionine beta-lyase